MDGRLNWFGLDISGADLKKLERAWGSVHVTTVGREEGLCRDGKCRMGGGCEGATYGLTFWRELSIRVFGKANYGE